MEELKGGRAGLVYCCKDHVYRPRGFWSESVHCLLSYLHQNGFNQVPIPLGFDDNGNEILSYVDGDVYNYPLTGNIASNEALISASQLLRSYHDKTEAFISSGLSVNSHWMLASRAPNEVVCHGDFAPYNVALNGCQTIGIFDFDTAHLGPRIWDVAYAIYCWAPFKTRSDDSLGHLGIQSSRAKLFCDNYGVLTSERRKLVTVMIERIQTLVEYMHSQASKGNQAFIDNIKNHHHIAYLADISYLKENQQVITDSLFE